MSLSNVSEEALLDLLFLNTDWADIGDAGGLQNSATAGSFYISLHTGDPGEAGDQSTSELSDASYTTYARVAVARSGAGWTRTGSTIENAALIQFAQCDGGTQTATHFAIGTASTGAGSIVLYGALSSSLGISIGIQPQFAAGALTATVN